MRDLEVQRQVAAPVIYRDVRLDTGFRLDLVVAGRVPVEIKAVERLLPVHDAQLRTYMKRSGFRLGFLINYIVPLVKDGIKRTILSR